MTAMQAIKGYKGVKLQAAPVQWNRPPHIRCHLVVEGRRLPVIAGGEVYSLAKSLTRILRANGVSA